MTRSSWHIATRWWRRQAALLAAGIGTLLTLLLTAGAYGVALREYRTQFTADAQARTVLMVDYLNDRLHDLDSLRRFIEGTDTLNRQTFQDFVRPLLRRHGVQALEWIPAIPAGQRTQAERDAVRNGLPGFSFTETAAEGGLKSAAMRERYYPVYFVEPLPGNEKALGYDLGSNPVRREAIRAAEATGDSQATAPLTLVQEQGRQAGFLVFTPVRATAARERGFALGVFRAGDMLRAALGPTAGKPLKTTVSDLSGKSGPQLLSEWQTDSPRTSGLIKALFPLPTLDKEIDFAGRRWNIMTSATPAYRARTASLQFLAILPAGLMITVLSSLYLRKLVNYGAEVEALVDERTTALAETNNRLMAEITGRQQARQQIEDEKIFLHTLQDTTPDLIFYKNADGIYLGCNEAFALGLLGLQKEEIIGRTDFDLFADQELATFFRERDREVMLATRPLTNDEWITMADGRRVLVETTKAPFHDRAGRVSGLIGVARDITRRRELEEALELSRQHMQIILDNLPHLAWLKDSELKFLMVNQQFADATGCSKEQIIGLTDLDVWPLDLAEAYRADDRAVMASGERKHVEERVDDVRGATWFETFKTPILSADGTVIGTSGIARDITERKRGEELLLSHQQELQSLNESLELRVEEEIARSREKDLIVLQQDKLASIGQLAAGVAHEINNPLAFITSNLRTFSEYFENLSDYLRIQREVTARTGPAAAQEELEAAARSLDISGILDDGGALIAESLSGVERVSRIVRDLMNFSRTDRVEFEEANLTACLESALTIVHNELKYHAVITRQYEEIPPVLCHPGQLNQVFLNLLVNAGHAVGERGAITIRAWCDDSFVYASVTDNGHGIPDKILNRIFEPFFTTKEVGKGTGLGLSISYEIMQKHRGEILVESAVGRGSTFTIKLPRVQEKCP